MRSTPHGADWISEGSLHGDKNPVVGGFGRRAAPFDLSAFGSCDMHETLRVSEVKAARARYATNKASRCLVFSFSESQNPWALISAVESSVRKIVSPSR